MVVKVKSKKPVRTYIIICDECEYELEYTKEDIKSVTHDYGYGSGNNIVYYIVCPRRSCKNEISVSKKV